ncbi:unnamed protein product [Closterium sp. NIES-64]|nr:unnamed protein product [Closterium sp. NIES-64]
MKRSDEKRAKSPKPSKKKVKTDSPSVKSFKKPKPSATATDGAAKSSLRADDDTWKQRASIDKDLADRSAGSDGDAADGAEPAAAGAAGKAGGGEAGTGDGYEEMTGLVLRNEEFEDGNTGGSGSGGVRCLHEVAYPKGWKLPTSKEAARKPLPEKPAKEYPFKLDPFQEEAVSAHTSAGKTVVAEYAIAMVMRDNQRVVYTSPIKPLPLSFPPPTHSPPLTAAGISTHISRQDCGGGIRHSHGDAGQPVSAHTSAGKTVVAEYAIAMAMRDNQRVVSAHTSAGKTVVAEYAIAMAMRDNQRVVYTSPIKALSNQKFREMSQEFGDVGLMTGDVTIAPNATCLVMTTEILRSMLYRGSDFVREVGWIIFDEVHYLRDKERGVVWEESIVMAPKSSRFVFLSATVPNAREFAEWVAKVHQQPCHIVYTDYRPTPLQHYIFPAGGINTLPGVHQQPCHIVYTDYRPTPLQHYILRAGGMGLFSLALCVHQQPCHIVYTDYRPTPLQHYIFPAGGMGLFLAVDEKGKFREASFQKAMNVVEGGEGGGGKGEDGEDGGKKGGKWGKGKRGAGGGGPGGAGGGGGGKKGEESDIYKIVKMIMQRQYDPVIVFSFSRADCEALALQMSRMDLNDDDEKTLIDGIFRNAIDSLAEEDKKLPQVNSMLPLLRRGIGIHHSGLLPLLKEVIEILFQEGLLKCLFATETFSIGLNMPAKTVVFTNVRKWDGTKSRWLSGGEYIQMSGRAGRRGLDDRGICILMVDSRMEPAVAKGMVKGSADPLVSAFHLSYNFILNQLRSPEVEIEQTIRSSYRQFQSDRALPALQARLQALEAEHSTISIPDESSLLALLSLRRQLSALRAQIRSSLTTPSLPQPNSRLSLPCPLSPPNRRACKHWKRSIQQSASLTSRLCGYCAWGEGGGAGGAEGEGEGEGGGEGGEAGGIGNEEDVTVWGVVVNFKKVNRKRGVGGGEQQDEAAEAAADVAYDVDILTRCVEEGSAGRMGPPGGPRKVVRPCRPGEEGGSPLVASFPLTQLDGISAVRLFLPKDLKHKEPREAALKSLQQLLLRAGADGVQMLDPEEDMEVNSSAYRKAVRRAEALEALIASHALASAPDLQVRVRELARKSKLKIALKVLKKEVKAAGGLILKDELKARMRVLRRLEYIDEDEIVRVKGRVACEISSADELVVTELLFSAALADLPPETVAALLSCCVWQEKGAGGAKRPRESLQGPLAQLREIARRIARVQEECKVRNGHVATRLAVVLRVAGEGRWQGEEPEGEPAGAADAAEEDWRCLGGAMDGAAFADVLNASFCLRSSSFYHQIALDVETYVASFRPDIMEAVFGWCHGAAFTLFPLPSPFCHQIALDVETYIALDVETYVASFRPDIMEAVFGWCHGAAFADVLAAADTFEGSLIRAMRRLEELLQEVRVGDGVLVIGLCNKAHRGSSRHV